MMQLLLANEKKCTKKRAKVKNTHCCNCDAVYFFVILNAFRRNGKELHSTKTTQREKKRNCSSKWAKQERKSEENMKYFVDSFPWNSHVRWNCMQDLAAIRCLTSPINSLRIPANGCHLMLLPCRRNTVRLNIVTVRFDLCDRKWYESIINWQLINWTMCHSCAFVNVVHVHARDHNGISIWQQNILDRNELHSTHMSRSFDPAILRSNDTIDVQLLIRITNWESHQPVNFSIKHKLWLFYLLHHFRRYKCLRWQYTVR